MRSVWLSTVCGVPLLRGNLGARRVERLQALARTTGSSLEPGPIRIASWLPFLAADLNRRQRFSLQEWEDFYRDVSESDDVLPWLAGKPIFRTGEGRLAHANTEAGSGSRFFISVERGQASR